MDIIPGINIRGKASVASVSKAGSSEGGEGHLGWLKIDLNATKVITVQDYKRTKS